MGEEFGEQIDLWSLVRAIRSQLVSFNAFHC